MEYSRNYEEIFPLEGADDVLADWVENRILDFVNTCTSPGNTSLLPERQHGPGYCLWHAYFVNGRDKHGRKRWPYVYFCSEHCKEAFTKGKQQI